MHSEDTPRRHLYRQDEQQEDILPGTPYSSAQPHETEEEAMEISSTSGTSAPPINSSSSVSVVNTTTSSSSSSSASKSFGMRRVRHSHAGQPAGGSTTSSSTEDSEARERRFGTIDLQHSLPMKSTTCGSSGPAGQDVTKGPSSIDPQMKQALLADFSQYYRVLLMFILSVVF